MNDRQLGTTRARDGHPQEQSRTETEVSHPAGPGFESQSRQFFLFLVWSLVIPSQPTRTQTILQASVGRMTENGGDQAEQYINKQARGRAIVPLEYDCA
jgi:hypothetical protein